MAKKFKKDLQGISEELQRVAKELDHLTEVAKDLEERVAESAKSETGTAKRAPVRKKIYPPAPPAPDQQDGKLSAIDTVLGHIQRSRNGLGIAALTEKTGYNRIKIYNIVGRLKKMGKIKSPGRGLYSKL